jgi:hypothetical protein
MPWLCHANFISIKRFFFPGQGEAVILGLELRAFTLNHSTSPIFVKDFSR